MNLNNELTIVDRAQFALGSLYRKYGYSQYKMSKFEEYDLYVRNKDFLISDSVITFTDTNGKLMALKPDVTLSIIKNSKDDDSVNKVYYNENVYRVSKGTHSFKEIMQVGLECIGNIDRYCVSEVLILAVESLKSISENCVLDISYMGIVTEILSKLGLSIEAEKAVVSCIGEKNIHDAVEICKKEGVCEEDIELLKKLISIYGEPKEALSRLSDAIGENTESFKEFKGIIDTLCKLGYEKYIRIDFSVINDMKYYNGIVFKGFVQGLPSGILSGGQYDNLMHRMNRRSGAIGFAVYLDLLEDLDFSEKEFDFDVAVVYENDCDSIKVCQFVAEQVKKGYKVTVRKSDADNLNCRRKYRVVNGEVVENA